jgi:hypothetical protein
MKIGSSMVTAEANSSLGSPLSPNNGKRMIKAEQSAGRRVAESRLPQMVPPASCSKLGDTII